MSEEEGRASSPEPLGCWDCSSFRCQVLRGSCPGGSLSDLPEPAVSDIFLGGGEGWVKEIYF